MKSLGKLRVEQIEEMKRLLEDIDEVTKKYREMLTVNPINYYDVELDTGAYVHLINKFKEVRDEE